MIALMGSEFLGCPMCGAAVWDADIHQAWHDERSNQGVQAVRELAKAWTRIGAHESTRRGGQLILDLLDGKPREPGAVLDLGTGPV